MLAEFWADGPQSETPPGHWNTIMNAGTVVVVVVVAVALVGVG